MRLPPLLEKLLENFRRDRDDAISGLRSDVQELVRAIRDNQDAYRQQQDYAQRLENNLPDRILRAQREINKYTQQEERSYRKVYLWIQMALVLGTWLTFIGAFVYAFVTLGQLKEMIRATDATELAASAAKAQTATAVDTLHKSQRPWVNAESFIATTIKLPPKEKFDVEGDLLIKNTGISVATEGWLMMSAVPTAADFLKKNWDKACRDTDERIQASHKSAAKGLGDNWPMGFVLAPNQETRLRFIMGDSSNGLIEKQIRNAVKLSNENPWIWPGQDPRAGQFYLLGCARYKDQFATHHTTRFCFVYLNEKNWPSGFYPCGGIATAD